MKTFGEIKEGDVMYSLNYTKFGVLTEHIVSEVKRDKYRTFIRIKGYEKRGLYEGAPDDEKYDLKIYRQNSATADMVAPSIEGVKQYWFEDHTNEIQKALKEIEEINKFISTLTKDIEIINSIK